MSVDVRGFEYAAEPVLRRRQWELDAAVADLGRTLEQVALAKSQARALQEQLAAQVSISNDFVGTRFDPVAHTRALAWLAKLQGRIAQAQQALARLEARREEVSERLRTLQSQVEAIEAHREDAVHDFAAAAAARVASEADRDWLARRAAAGASVKVQP